MVLPFTPPQNSQKPSPFIERLDDNLEPKDRDRLLDLIVRFLALARSNPSAGSLVLAIGDLVLRCFDA